MLLLTLVIIFLLILIYKRQQQMTILKNFGIPGPKPNFILGNLIDIAKDGMIGIFPKWTNEYGPIVGFYIGGRPQVLITDFELIRLVMIKDFNIFSNKSQCIPGGVHPQPQLQNMLVWAKDSTWRQLRASLSPSFSSYKLNAMEPLIMPSIDNFFAELDDKAKSGEEFNIKPLVYEFTFTSGTKCIFGLNLSLNAISNESKNFLQSTSPRLETSVLAIAMVLFPLLEFIVHPLRVLWESLRLHMLWSPEGVCYDVVRKVVQVRKDSNIRTTDFLQLLMNATKIRSPTDIELEMSSEEEKTNDISFSKTVHSEKLSEEEVLSNAMLFLLASFETTSVTLQFVMHNLTNHQDVQEKLRNELKKAIDKGSNKITLSNVSKVPLLNNVIKETLRMFPPVSPFTQRLANENYDYKGFRIPKGAGVFIGVTSIHNDPTLWPEPEKFRPERFENDFDKLSFLPFGAGPRNCIGMRFAYMELQLALANLILKYRFEPGPSTEKNIETVETFATLVPKNGVFCKVIRLED